MGDRAAIRLIGDHTGDGLQEVALLYVRALAPPSFAPALAVVDVDLQSVLANATSPAGLTTFDGGYPLRADPMFPSGPGGRVYPALLPGYGDSNNDLARRWGWGCLFRAGASSPDCGGGFLRLDLQPASVLPYGSTVWFREAVGHLQDLDGDGWEDLDLPYHWAFLALSGQSGGQLAATVYDVAAATGAQPPVFHSGRNYGTHRATTAGAVKRRRVFTRSAQSRRAPFGNPRRRQRFAHAPPPSRRCSNLPRHRVSQSP